MTPDLGMRINVPRWLLPSQYSGLTYSNLRTFEMPSCLRSRTRGLLLGLCKGSILSCFNRSSSCWWIISLWWGGVHLGGCWEVVWLVGPRHCRLCVHPIIDRKRSCWFSEISGSSNWIFGLLWLSLSALISSDSFSLLSVSPIWFEHFCWDPCGRIMFTWIEVVSPFILLSGWKNPITWPIDS